MNLENEIVEMKTFLGEQLGYKKERDNKGYVGRLFKELFTFKKETETTMNGTDNTMGIRTKIAIVWKTYMSVACAVSAVIGFFAKDVYDKLF